MSDKFDFKKEYKDLYMPKATPAIIEVPEMVFITVDGKGNPNTSEEYKNAMEVLYGLSYSIKMSKMNGTQPDGYFDYVVPPLEGLWTIAEQGINFDGRMIVDKEKFVWTSMIRQPEFVTEEVFEKAKDVLLKKKPEIDLSTTRLVRWTEGLCVQIMHYGPYDTEPADIKLMDKYVLEHGYKNDINEVRRHHEIYLGDPRKTKPENLRTVIRHPIVRA
ncbi:MAG: GyrI-like domain-containing protein [Clostridiales bacterium]|nr:GyrI-like domain-containing protein [Clostridiales bacterium]